MQCITTTSSLSEGVLVPLLAEGRGGRISSMLSLRSQQGESTASVSSLISVDESGNLTLLQQDAVSKIWQEYPLWHASSDNVMEVNGYMLRMHATIVNDDGKPNNESASLIPGCG